MRDVLTYVLPRRAQHPPNAELTSYLRAVSGWCPLVVVDGSPQAVYRAAHEAWSSFAIHVPPDAAVTGANGKVRGVVTGMRLVATPLVVIADDDVRYDADGLQRVVDELATADLVVPQNHFEPLPWHARWDTARTLLNRATGGDFPGTLGVRTAFARGGYDGDVLFENLELMRTVEARGGRCRRCPDLLVRRLPPTTEHFAGQRVRQAYDELARPARLLTWLSVLPALLLGRQRGRRAALVAAAAIMTAERGRRVDGGRQYFPWTSSLLAPLWVAERAVCSWLALAARARGGVRYADGRLRRAATPLAQLRRQEAHRGTASTATPTDSLRSAAVGG